MRGLQTSLRAILLGFIGVNSAAGVPIQWSGNGHYYEVTGPGTNWPNACEAARQLSYQGLNGHLVTFNTQAEFDFVNGNVIPGNFEAFWAGAYQDPGGQECNGGWHWVAGNEDPMAVACLREVYNRGCGSAQEDVAEFSCSNALWNDSAWCQCRRYVVEYEPGSFVCPVIDESGDCLSACSLGCSAPGGPCSPDPNSCSSASSCSGGGTCPNGVCDPGENSGNCPADCGGGAVCGDFVCESGENCCNCASDCPGNCPDCIPTVSEWGLAIMVLCCTISGTIIIQRREALG